MKALITGITGFVGSHLAEYILENHPDAEVLGLVRWRSPKENIEEILDRIEIPPLDSIPDLDLVKAEGIETWIIPNTEIKITQVKEGNRLGEFLFDASTIERIREFYERVKDLPYRTKGTEGMYTSYTSSAGRLLAPKWLSWIDRLPPWMKQTYKGQTIWQWVALVHAFLIAILIPLIIHLLFKPLFRRLGSPWLDWMRLFVPITLLLSLALTNFLIFCIFHCYSLC